MGGKNSKEIISAESEQHINNLEHRLGNLENEEKSLVDKLRSLESQREDGDITKKEMIEQMRESIKSKDRKIEKLRKEIKVLKKSVLEAESQYERLQSDIAEGRLDSEAYQSMVSMRIIEDQVKDWMKDPNVNVYLVPDQMEVYIYKKIIGAFLSGLEKMFSSISFVLLGHNISVIMRPIKREN